MGFNLKQAGETAAESSGEFKALPEGRYNIVAEAAENGTSQNGNDTIKVTFNVLDAPYTRRKVWNTFTLTPKAMVFVGAFLNAGGATELLKNEDISKEDLAKGMVGLRANVWTEPGVNGSGNPKNDLKSWKAVDEDAGAEAAPVAEKKAELFK